MLRKRLAPVFSDSDTDSAFKPLVSVRARTGGYLSSRKSGPDLVDSDPPRAFQQNECTYTSQEHHRQKNSFVNVLTKIGSNASSSSARTAQPIPKIANAKSHVITNRIARSNRRIEARRHQHDAYFSKRFCFSEANALLSISIQQRGGFLAHGK